MKKKQVIAGIVILAAVLTISIVFIKNQKGGRDILKKESGYVENVTEKEPEYIEIEKTEVSYEKWLAASVIISIAMDYPDFELNEIYIVSENKVNERMNSEGIFVTYQTEGEKKCVYSKPINSARKKTGTFDIYSEYLKYATYEEREVESIDLEKYHSIEIENMNTLIEQLGRVTKYMN